MSEFFAQFPRLKYDFSGQGIPTTMIDIFRFIKADDLLLDDLSTYQYYQVRGGDRPDVVSNLLYGSPDYYWTFFIINDTLKTGLTGWPMSSEQFEKYIADSYDGTVIETRPTVIRDSDGLVIDYRDSLAGRFNLVGETVIGALSGASGKVVSKDVQLSQLVIGEITGTFQVNESIVGQESQDTIAAYRVWDWSAAPHHYEDGAGRELYNAIHINEQGGTGVDPGHSDSEVKAVSNLDYETQLDEQRANIRVVRPELIADFARTYETLLNNA